MEIKRIPWEKAQFFLTEGGGLPQDNPPPEAALRLLRLAVRQELTPRQRQCVELYFFQGMTMEETGKALGIGNIIMKSSKKHLFEKNQYSTVSINQKFCPLFQNVGKRKRCALASLQGS